MSREVDERIVKMEFQNKDFQSNAEKTIKTLDELEQSLEFKSGISKSLDVVASKFTNMGMVAHRVVQNITDDIYGLGKNMVKSLTVGQLQPGFAEYELKMGSIQTIMASTGESLDVVNKKLAELNEYSDKTIYSFRDMTSNIGKFTNAGVKLTPAVNAMKGIANLAAVSGANSEQASHAMYNFAQALSAGYVKLVDWKSIEIANMATMEFKNQLIETALDLKTIRKEGDKYISTTQDMNGKVSDAFDATHAFNESLSSQWLTTDVLTATLEKYASETTDIGKKANKSATEIKTFTMAIGALKESAGSGWAKTMEIIFGDYDEALKLWTDLFHRIDGWLGTMADERNKVLNAWKTFSGRDMLIEGFNNILDISESISEILSKSTRELLSYNKGWRYLDESMETIDIGPIGNVMYENLVKATAAFRDFTKTLKPSEKTISNISDIMLGFITIIRDVWSIVSPIVGFTLKVLKILSPLLKIVIAVLGALGRCIYVLSELRRKLFNLGPAAKSFNEFLDGIYNNVNSWADKTVELIGNVPEALKRAIDNINSVDLPDLSDIGKSLMEGLTNAVANFKEKNTLSSFFDGFFNTESIKETGRKIKEICSDIGENISQFVEKVKNKLRSSGPLGEFLVNVFEIVANAAVVVSNIAKKAISSLGETLSNVTEKLKEFFKGFNIDKAIKLAQVASFIVAMIKFGKSLKTISGLAADARNLLASLNSGITAFGDAVKDIGKGVKMELQAEAFKNIAFGLGVIVASIIALTTVDVNKLEDAVLIFLKISAIVSLLVIVVSEFSVKTEKASTDISGSAKSLNESVGSAVKTVAKGFANSMMISALGASAAMLATLLGSITVMLVALSAIDSATLSVRVRILKDVFKMLMLLVAEIGAVMAAIVLIDKIPTNGDDKINSVISSAAAIFALSKAITSLILPVIAFANIDADKLKKGMLAVSALIAEAIAAFAAIAFVSAKFPEVSDSLKSVSASLAAFSFALLSLIAPIFLLGSMDPERLSKGLWALGHIIAELSILLVAFGLALRVMGKDSGSAVKMGLAFGLLAASVTAFATMAPAIMKNIETIREAVGVLVKVLVNAIVSSANDIISGILDLVDVVLNAIDKYLPTILSHLGTVLDSVLAWLEESLPGYMSQIARIVGKSLSSFAETAKEHINLSEVLVLAGGIIGIIMLVKQITKMSEQIKKATPYLLALSGMIAILGIVINEIVKNSKDSTSAISAAASITICLFSMVEFAKKMPDITEAMKKVKIGKTIKAVISIGIVVAGIAGLFAIMQKAKLDPKTVLEYGIGLGAIFYSFPKIIQYIVSATKATKKLKKNEIGKMFVVIGQIALILGMITGSIMLLSLAGMSPETMTAYSLGMTAVLLSMALILKTLSSISKEANNAQNVKPIVSACIKLTVIIGAVTAMFVVLNSFELDPMQMLKYAAVMSLVFLSLVPLIAAIGIAEKRGSKMTMWRQFLGQTIELAVIMGGVLGIFLLLNSSGMDPYNMVGYAVGMSAVFLAMVPMLKALGETAKSAKDTTNFGQFGGIALDIVAIIAALGAVFLALDKFGVNPRDMVTRSIALGIAFVALNPMLKALGKAAEGAKDTGFKSLLGILVDVAGIAVALGGVFWAFDKLDVDPVTIKDYAIGLGIAFTGLSPMLLAIGKAADWGGSNLKAGPLLSVAPIILALGVVIGGLVSVMVTLKADPEKVMEYAKSLSLMALAMTPIVLVVGLLGALFSKVNADPKVIIKGGLAVVAVVAAALVIMSGIIGLLGLLNSDGYLSDAVEKGNEVLVSLAEGLGAFVGAVVGSGIGAGLGSFAESAKPFFDAITTLPDNFGDKVKGLASGLLALSGAAFIEQISNLFNLFGEDKDASLEKLGEDLNDFAPEMVKLSKSLKRITPEQAEIMKYAGEGLKAIIDAIPKENGMFQNIFGEVDVSGFGDDLNDLGEGVADFTNSVKDIDKSDVSHGVACAEMLVELSKKIPPNSGVWPFIKGLVDVGKFGDNLPKLGEGIAGFNEAITSEGTSKLNKSAIESATAALDGLALVTQNVDENTGFLPAISGFADMEKFARNVAELGNGIGKFGYEVQDVDSDKSEKAISLLKTIAQIDANDIRNATFDLTIVDEFQRSMYALSDGFGDVVSVLNEANSLKSVPSSQVLTNMLLSVMGLEGLLETATMNEDTVYNFKNSIEDLAEGFSDIVDIFEDIETLDTGLDSTSLFQKAEQIKQTIKNKLVSNPGNSNGYPWKAGKNITLGVSNGLLDIYAVNSLKNSCQTMVDYAFSQIQLEADEHSPSKRAEKDGANLTKGYANGITKDLNGIKSASKILVNEAFNSMSSALTKAYKLMNENDGFQPVIAPVVDLSNAKRSASELNNLFSGMSTNMSSELIPTKAIKISEGVKIETDAQRSVTDMTKMTDIVLRIGSKLDSLESNMDKMQVVLDSGELVGGMTAKLMRSIKRQQTNINRGVIPSVIR